MLKLQDRDYISDVLWDKEWRSARLLFNSMKDTLFLEEDEKSSRVEAYSSDLISRPPKIVTNEHGGEEQQSSVPDEITINQDEFQIIEMVALRSSDAIAAYKKETNHFRAFFIRQRFSYAALSIAPSLFQSLSLILKMPARMQELVLYFGDRDREVEIIPPRLTHRHLSRPGHENGTGYECMYVIRYFEKNGRGTPQEPSMQWSMRQTAVYNRFEPDVDGSTWVFVALSREVQKRIDEYVAQNANLREADNFELHWLLLRHALCNWRTYLIDLAAEVDEHTAQVAGMSPDDQGPISLSDATKRQEIMLLDERLLNATLVAKATADMANTLRISALDSISRSDTRAFYLQNMLNEQISDLDLYLVQLESLRVKLSSASTLLSSFLDLGSGLALQNLARESRQENEAMRELSERMHELTKKSTRDAAAVKVLTILTLIYLPATVVSNFFSTSFVGSDASSGHITVSSDWWILLVISVPLTAFTLYVWYVWKNHQADGIYPCWWSVFGSPESRRKSTLSRDKDEADEKV